MFLQLWRSRLRYYALHHGWTYNRLVHGLVRLGMRAEARRALQELEGPRLTSRLRTARTIYALAS
jgi:pentatricopeptide repeat protein